MVGKHLYIEQRLELGNHHVVFHWDRRTAWHLLFDLPRDAWILGQLIGSPGQNAGHRFLGKWWIIMAGRCGGSTFCPLKPIRARELRDLGELRAVDPGHPGDHSDAQVRAQRSTRCACRPAIGVLAGHPIQMVLLMFTPEKISETGILQKHSNINIHNYTILKKISKYI